MDNNAIERAWHHHPGQELRRELEGRTSTSWTRPDTRTSAAGRARAVDGRRRHAALIDAGKARCRRPFRDQGGAGWEYRPIVVVNKVDKPGANCDKVISTAFDLFDRSSGRHRSNLTSPWSTAPQASATGRP